MSNDIYDAVRRVIDDQMGLRNFIAPENEVVQRAWLEDFTQNLLLVIRPEPAPDAFEGYGNEYAALTHVQKVVALTLLELEAIRNNWQIEQRVSETPNRNLRAADDIEGMINAMTFCRWLLSPWRKSSGAWRS